MAAQPPRYTHLVARRGDVLQHPENSLPALRGAIGHGARFLMVDVQLSADEVPVLARDSDLARTAGVEASVFELAAQELAHLALELPPGARGFKPGVPRLADLVALLGEHPELTAFLELRRASLAHHGADVVLGRVLEAVRPARAQCILVSSDLGAVCAARERARCRIGWLLPAYDEHARLKYEALQPDFLVLARARLPPAGRLWRGPWRWVVLDVDEPAEALECANRGADFVASGRVATLSGSLRQRARAG